MECSSVPVCFQRQQRSKSFSVTKHELKAIKVAKRIVERLPDEPLCDNNVSNFLRYLSQVAEVPYLRSMQMINGLAPFSGKVDAIRIAYAIMEYLPCFDKEDDRMDPVYDGSFAFPIHVKIAGAKYQEGKRPQVVLKLLALTSIFAGRYFSVFIPERQAIALIKKLYSGRVPAPLIGLSGCYMCISSKLVIGSLEDVKICDYVKTCSSERSINRELYNNREKRTCHESRSCYSCTKGRDKCSIACREITKEVKNESTGEADRVHPAAN